MYVCDVTGQCPSLNSVYYIVLKCTTLHCKFTKGKGFDSISNILAINSNKGEAHLVSNLYSIVAVLQFLHITSYSLEGFLLVDLGPIYNAWLNLVKQLKVKNIG